MRSHFVTSSFAFLLFLLFIATGCKKNTSTQTPAEENLVISTDAGSYAFSPGPNFSFNLTVNSAMPPAGILIFFDVKAEIDNQVFVQPPMESTSKIVPVIIRNLPLQTICICTIKVISKINNSNTATTNFRVVYK